MPGPIPRSAGACRWTVHRISVPYILASCLVLAACDREPPGIELRIEGAPAAIAVDNLRWKDAEKRQLLADITLREAPVHQLRYSFHDEDGAVLHEGFYWGTVLPRPGQTRAYELPPPIRYEAQGGAVLDASVASASRLVLTAVRVETPAALAREPAAIQQRDAACQLGDFMQCQDLALHFGTGPLARRPDPALFERYRSAFVDRATELCERDRGDACFALGSALYRGDIVAADRARAQALLEKACELKAPMACDTVRRLPRP